MAKKNPFTYRLLGFLMGTILLEIVCGILIWQLLEVFGYFSVPTVSSDHLIFLYPKYAWLFLSIPLIILGYLVMLSKRNRKIKQFKSQSIYKTFLTPVSTKRVFTYFTLIQLTVIGLIFALMQPAIGKREIQGKTNGVEMVFAIDVSNSMNTKDLRSKEPRLRAVKRVANQLINKTKTARIGLVIFAGDAYIQLPLTANKNAVKVYISNLSTEAISNQGTNISSALQKSSQLFSDDKTKKVLVLITDGEDHGGDLSEGYSAIKNKNITTYLIGIGSKNGGLIPAKRGASQWVRNKDGDIVKSRLNRKMLQQINQQLDGDLIISDSPFPNISKFLTEINNSSKGKGVHLKFKVHKNRYQWPLCFALITLFGLLILGSFPIRKE